MIPLDLALLKKFLKRAGDELTGDWLLIGGTILPLMGVDYRSTTDIDLIPLGKREHNSALLNLMQLTEKLGLPIDTINSAGFYFLEKISNYSQQMVVLRRGKTATIFRPNINLFLRLKMGRLTESDLSDCLQFMKIASKLKESIDPLIPKLIEVELRIHAMNKEKLQRLTELQRAVSKQLSKT
jgi:hypothetical protein